MVQVLINSKGLNMNPIQSLYYVSPACLVCLLVPFGECMESKRPWGTARFRSPEVACMGSSCALATYGVASGRTSSATLSRH